MKPSSEIRGRLRFARGRDAVEVGVEAGRLVVAVPDFRTLLRLGRAAGGRRAARFAGGLAGAVDAIGIEATLRVRGVRVADTRRRRAGRLRLPATRGWTLSVPGLLRSLLTVRSSPPSRA